jgi:hypothetical protein
MVIHIPVEMQPATLRNLTIGGYGGNIILDGVHGSYDNGVFWDIKDCDFDSLAGWAVWCSRFYWAADNHVTCANGFFIPTDSKVVGNEYYPSFYEATHPIVYGLLLYGDSCIVTGNFIMGTHASGYTQIGLYRPRTSSTVNIVSGNRFNNNDYCMVACNDVGIFNDNTLISPYYAGIYVWCPEDWYDGTATLSLGGTISNNKFTGSNVYAFDFTQPGITLGSTIKNNDLTTITNGYWFKLAYSRNPIAPTAVSSGTAGSVTIGDHYVKLTALTSAGETSPSSASAKCTLADSSHSIDVSGIPAIGGIITGYNVYMTTAGTTTYYKVATVTDTTYNITMDDTTLAAQSSIPTINTTIPTNTGGVIAKNKGYDCGIGYSASNFPAFADGDTTPSVFTSTKYKTANTGSTAIGNLLSGGAQKEVLIYINDGTAGTLSNTTFATAGSYFAGYGALQSDPSYGAVFKPYNGDMVRATYDGGKWRLEWLKIYSPPNKYIARTVVPLDLSGAAATEICLHVETHINLLKATILYTEASSADAGVNIKIGKESDDDYFYTGTSEASKAQWYSSDVTLLQKWLYAGDTLLFSTVGGKSGTGEVLLIVEYYIPGNSGP